MSNVKKDEDFTWKFTQCKGCGSRKPPLFARVPFRGNDDYWCKDCLSQKKHV